MIFQCAQVQARYHVSRHSSHDSFIGLARPQVSLHEPRPSRALACVCSGPQLKRGFRSTPGFQFFPYLDSLGGGGSRHIHPCAVCCRRRLELGDTGYAVCLQIHVGPSKLWH